MTGPEWSTRVRPSHQNSALDRLVFSGLVSWIAKPLQRRLAPGSRLVQIVRPVLMRVLGGRRVVIRVVAGPAAGTRLLIDSRNEKFYWAGRHEQHLLAELRRALRPGDCLWDVGAHIGYVSCFAAREVAPTGTVVAFEPQPATRERLNRTIELNGVDNIIVAPVAIAQTSGVGELFAGGTSATWSLASRKGGDSVIVDCLTLDDAVKHLPAPTVIKVDAEGLELEVLMSGRVMLQQRRPSLLVEFTSSDIVERTRTELPDYSFRLIGQNHWLLTPPQAST